MNTNAGILVNIASPNNIPETKISERLLDKLTAYSAVRIELSKNGSKSESNNIRRKIQENGMTANSTEATSATFLLYFLSAIL
jgi:hypothetical protein